MAGRRTEPDREPVVDHSFAPHSFAPHSYVAGVTGRAQHDAVVDAMRAFVQATDRYIDERGGAAGLHRTDLDALTHVLDAADAGDTITPGALSELLRLSPPATTALLGRLEQVGHVRRTHSRVDRRRVEIEVSEQALEVAGAVFAPLGAAMGRMMSRYSEAELDVVLRFLHDAVEATRSAPDLDPAHGSTAPPSTGRSRRRSSTGRA